MRNLYFVIIGLVLATSCGIAQDVRYNFDRDTNFSKFKTYRWVLIKDAAKTDNLLDKQIKAAVDAQLAMKGLSRVDADPADLYVAYQPAVNQEKEFSSYSSGGPGWGYGGGWYGGGWYGSTMTTGQTSTIYVGQLAIDMYDSANHDLVWRAVGSKTLDPKAKPEKQQKNLTKAVTKMFKNYPPVKK